MAPGFEYFNEGKIFHAAVPRVMGTRLDFIVIGEDKDLMAAMWDGICSEAAGLDKALNRFDPTSEVSRFNGCFDEAPFEASEELIDIVRVSMDWNLRTGGLFDITRGKADCLACCGGTLQKFDPDVTLDFGGIAKGYFMGHVKSRFEAAGVKCAFVNFGQSAILAVGRHPHGENWQVSIPNPWGWQSVARAELVDCFLSTSGNSPASFGHIINPLTGEVVRSRRLACVMSDSPLEAEVLSTALLIADDKQREKLQKTFTEATIEVYEL